MRAFKFIIIVLATGYMSLYTNLVESGEIHMEAQTTSATFLKIGIGARALAMGGAYLTLADDPSAVYWNPAGLSLVPGKSLAGMHNEWGFDMRHEFLCYAHPLGNHRTLAGGAIFLDVGDIEGRDELGNPTGNLVARDYAFLLSYGWKQSKDLHIGAGLKVIRQQLHHEVGYSAAFDLGLFYRGPIENLSAGAVVQNLGVRVKFREEAYDLPTSFKIGASYRIPAYNLLVAADVEKPLDSYVRSSLGVEYLFREKYALRGGYQFGAEKTYLGAYDGFSTGFGLKLGEYDIDYALVSHGDLGLSHLVSGKVRFGQKAAGPNKEPSITHSVRLNPWDDDDGWLFAGEGIDITPERARLYSDGDTYVMYYNKTSEGEYIYYHSSFIARLGLSLKVSSHVKAEITYVAENRNLCSGYTQTFDDVARLRLTYQRSLWKNTWNMKIIVGDLWRRRTGCGLVYDEFEGEGRLVYVYHPRFFIGLSEFPAGLTEQEDVYVAEAGLSGRLLGIHLIHHGYHDYRDRWIIYGGSMLPASQWIPGIFFDIPFVSMCGVYGEFDRMYDRPESAGSLQRDAYLLGGRFELQNEDGLIHICAEYRKYERDFNESLVRNLAAPFYGQETRDKRFNTWSNYLMETGEVEGEALTIQVERRVLSSVYLTGDVERVRMIRPSGTEDFTFLQAGFGVGFGAPAQAYCNLTNKILNPMSSPNKVRYTFTADDKVHLWIGMKYAL